MFRLLKALPFTLALASLCFFAASCGSSSQSQIRVVNAIPDSSSAGLDFDVNKTKEATAIQFDGVQPTPPAYTKASSGSVTFQAYVTGTTTNPLFGANGVTGSLSGSSAYTIILSGFTSNPTVLTKTDNNAAPASGNIEFRIIHSSSSNQSPVDVYIVPPGTDITNVNPQISGLAYQQASSYQSLGFPTNGYDIIVTANGNKTPLNNFVFFYNSPQNSIRTMVLVDVPGGGQMSPTPVVLNDLN
jgi:hypothetical protein